MKNNLIFRQAILLFILCFPVFIYSQAEKTINQDKQLIPSFDTDTALIFTSITLGAIIIILAVFLKSAIRFHFHVKGNNTVRIAITGICSTLVAQAYSQSTTISNVQANFIFSPLSWFLLVVIGLEIYAIFNLIHWMKFYTGIENYESTLTRKRINLWNKINAFQPMESESRIDVGHDYDGIRELDNITPPWFVAAFAGSILFAAVYMYRYHIAESAPLQIQEYEISVREAELNKLEDLKNQANFVDENSVTMLEAGQYEEGKSIYKMTCTVCHGDKGQGLVGPNITDEYWLHGGSMKDIFSTIKYGVLDKGMKSWKDDYSPNQIAQLASYIKSLKGTNPPEPKAAQGELYKEEIPVLKNPEMNKDSTNLSSNE